MTIDYTAARARIAQAGEALDVNVSPILALSDEQMNEGGEVIGLIARLLPGQSLDWIFLGDPRGMIHDARTLHNRANTGGATEIATRLMALGDFDAPLTEALALARVLDGAGRGHLMDMTYAGDTVTHVASMVCDRITAAMAEIEAMRADMTGAKA